MTDTRTEDVCPGGRGAAHVSPTGALTSLLRREDPSSQTRGSGSRSHAQVWGCRRGCILTPNPRHTQDTGTKVGEQGPDGRADQSAPPTGDTARPTGDTALPLGDAARPRET